MASVSPQPADPAVRERLIEAAARVLGDEGPSGLSTRKLAAEVGTSTMAVYTHFGSLPGLVAAVVDEGFARLAQHMADAARTDDALADLADLAVAYRANALANRHLYAVMFGSASLGGYRHGDHELQHRRNTFDVLVAATQRAMDEGVLTSADAESVAAQLWSALHGYVTLELAGFLREEEAASERVLWPLLGNLITALGAAPDQPPASPTTGRRGSRSTARPGAARGTARNAR
jgi:AcrR family transcriptional regulator